MEWEIMVWLAICDRWHVPETFEFIYEPRFVPNFKTSACGAISKFEVSEQLQSGKLLKSSVNEVNSLQICSLSE